MKRRAAAGYTILEVMIVMAVTAMLFMMTVIAFNGRQGETETTQTVRDFEAKIQGVANDVANGYFPNGFRCTADTVGSDVDLFPAPDSASVGANAGCIFLGKVMAFGSTSAYIFTVVGRQFERTIGSLDSSTLLLAKPKAVAQTGGPDVTETYPYKFSLRVTRMLRLSDNSPVGAIAFMSELGGATGGSNPLTGSRSTLLYGINTTTTPTADSIADLSNKITYVDASDSFNFVAIPDGVRICFLGTNGRKAEMTIGAGGNQTSTFVSIDSGASSVCNP
jgi:type II secretory pathway pseudopilin PulG